FYLIQLFQKSQYIWSQTVRAGANRNSRYLRMIYSLCIDFSQIFHRGVGIGVGLKISNKSRCISFLSQFFRLLVDLFCDRVPAVPGKVSRASLTAEDAAPFSKGAVPVGTGHASVESCLIYLAGKAFLQHVIKRVIRFSIPA